MLNFIISNNLKLSSKQTLSELFTYSMGSIRLLLNIVSNLTFISIIKRYSICNNTYMYHGLVLFLYLNYDSRRCIKKPIFFFRIPFRISFTTSIQVVHKRILPSLCYKNIRLIMPMYTLLNIPRKLYHLIYVSKVLILVSSYHPMSTIKKSIYVDHCLLNKYFYTNSTPRRICIPSIIYKHAVFLHISYVFLCQCIRYVNYYKYNGSYITLFCHYAQSSILSFVNSCVKFSIKVNYYNERNKSKWYNISSWLKRLCNINVASIKNVLTYLCPR